MMDRRFLTHKPQPHDKILWLIIVLVLTVHVLVFIWTAYFDQTRPKPILRSEIRRLTVQTITLQTPAKRPSSPLIAATSAPKPAPITQKAPPSEVVSQPKKVTSTPSPPAPPKPVPKTTTAPAKKIQLPQPSTTQKNPPPKSPAPKPTIVKTEPKPSPKILTETAAQETALGKQTEGQIAQARDAKERQQALISQAQERIAKITPSHDKIATSQTPTLVEMALPGPISNLKVDSASESGVTSFGGREASYHDELASRMKLLLRLPEYGDVKMKLTLDRTGKVLNVAISSAQNANNRKYIEKAVFALSFPPFGNHFGDETQHTFSITFSNDL
jgi:colicin import membrane protein